MSETINPALKPFPTGRNITNVRNAKMLADDGNGPGDLPANVFALDEDISSVGKSGDYGDLSNRPGLERISANTVLGLKLTNLAPSNVTVKAFEPAETDNNILLLGFHSRIAEGPTGNYAIEFYNGNPAAGGVLIYKTINITAANYYLPASLLSVYGDGDSTIYARFIQNVATAITLNFRAVGLEFAGSLAPLPGI